MSLKEDKDGKEEGNETGKREPRVVDLPRRLQE